MAEATVDKPSGANPGIPKGIALYCVVTGLLAASTLMIATPVLLDPPADDPLVVLPLLLMVVKLVIVYGLLKLRAWSWALEVLWLTVYAVTSLGAGELPGVVVAVGLLAYFLTKYDIYLDRSVGSA